jgi:hypothetical protein
MPCDGLDHIGESWTEEHDENGHYLRAHGTGNYLTYTHDFGTGDFTMTAQMKLFDLDGSAGADTKRRIEKLFLMLVPSVALQITVFLSSVNTHHH